MTTDTSTYSYADSVPTSILDSFFLEHLTKSEKGVKPHTPISVTASGEGCGKTSFGNIQTEGKSPKDGTMSNNMHFVSTCEIEGTIEIIEDLMALTEASEYLREEAKLVIDMLREGDSIPMEAYIKLNELQESLQ